MNIQKKTSSGVQVVPADTEFLADRMIWVQDTIDAEAARSFVKSMLILNKEDPKAPIKVIISSNGGSVAQGLAMYDAIQSSPAPVETYCVGSAYSMAAVLFASGRHGRYILPNSKVMLHEPLISDCGGGSASSIKSLSDSLLETKKQINELLCKHTGRTPKEMEKATGFDHYFSAQEAIDFGLADEIVGIDRILKGNDI